MSLSGEKALFSLSDKDLDQSFGEYGVSNGDALGIGREAPGEPFRSDVKGPLAFWMGGADTGSKWDWVWNDADQSWYLQLQDNQYEYKNPQGWNWSGPSDSGVDWVWDDTTQRWHSQPADDGYIYKDPGSWNWTGEETSTEYYGTPGADELYLAGGYDALYGVGGDDKLYGKSDYYYTVYDFDGRDILSGGSGDDYIQGGRSAESIIGGSGSDTLVSGGGSDAIDGGSGLDTLNYSSGDSLGAFAPIVRVDLEAGTAEYLGSSSTLAGVERVTGGGGDDDLRGDAFGNVLDGGSGGDVIFGRDGYDILYGRGGNDIIYGGEGSDTLYGGSGVDTLFGGQGADVIDGGLGRDVLYGGFGADTFRYSSSAQSRAAAPDVIKDFVHGDKLDVSALNVHGLDDFTVTYTGSGAVLSMNDQDFTVQISGGVQLGEDDFIWS